MHGHTDQPGTDGVVLLNLGSCDFFFDIGKGAGVGMCQAQKTEGVVVRRARGRPRPLDHCGRRARRALHVTPARAAALAAARAAVRDVRGRWARAGVSALREQHGATAQRRSDHLQRLHRIPRGIAGDRRAATACAHGGHSAASVGAVSVGCGLAPVAAVATDERSDGARQRGVGDGGVGKERARAWRV